jgi:hypothetical protein
MNTGFANLAPSVFMGSGLIAARCPGMTPKMRMGHDLG